MIYTLTLNPAIDKIQYLEKIERNTTNRVRSQTQTVGGKGTHVSMNLSALGVENGAFGLAYGAAGRYIIDELKKWNVQPWMHYRSDAQSRTNYLLIEDDGSCTIIAEKGVTPTERDMEALLKIMEERLRQNDWLVLSGDASNCSDPYIYNRIMRKVRARGVRVILDSSGATLKNGLEERPYLIKPNQNELVQLTNRPADSIEAVKKAADALYAAYQIPIIAISLGAEGSLVRTQEGGAYRAKPPKVAVKNTAGCGDCFLAGLLEGLGRGRPMEETLAGATAISAAAAESNLSVGYDQARAEELRKDCRVQRL